MGAWKEVGLLDSIELSVALRTAYYWMHHGAADDVAEVLLVRARDVMMSIWCEYCDMLMN